MPKKELTPQEAQEIGEVLEEVQEHGIKIGAKGWEPKHSIAFGKLGGRPRVMYDDLEQLVIGYITNCIKVEKMLTFEGLAVHLGIDSDTLRAVLRRMPNPERFFGKLKYLKDAQKDLLINKALKGEWKERLSMFLMNINHNMVETKESNINIKGSISVLDAFKKADKPEVIDVTPEQSPDTPDGNKLEF